MIHPASPSVIQQAAELLKKGELVAFPTETVYGLGADATNPQAVAKIFAVKQRPHFDPIIVHVGSVGEARSLWESCPPLAEKLMQAFWPGPLTIVLPKTPRIPDIVTAGLPGVGLRMPAHPVAQALIKQAGVPLAAPSANRFGRSSPTTAEAVSEELGSLVSMVIDGGPASVGIESTVITLEEGKLVLLRPGGVTLEALKKVAGAVSIRERSAQPLAPGMLERHYAPATPLYLLWNPNEPFRTYAPGRKITGPIGVLSLAPVALPVEPACMEVLSVTGDLTEAAANFFQALRRLDRQGLNAILAIPMPPAGLGLALTDRLKRASSGLAVLYPTHVEVLENPLQPPQKADKKA